MTSASLPNVPMTSFPQWDQRWKQTSEQSDDKCFTQVGPDGKIFYHCHRKSSTEDALEKKHYELDLHRCIFSGLELLERRDFSHENLQVLSDILGSDYELYQRIQHLHTSPMDLEVRYLAVVKTTLPSVQEVFKERAQVSPLPNINTIMSFPNLASNPPPNIGFQPLPLPKLNASLGQGVTKRVIPILPKTAQAMVSDIQRMNGSRRFPHQGHIPRFSLSEIEANGPESFPNREFIPDTPELIIRHVFTKQANKCRVTKEKDYQYRVLHNHPEYRTPPLHMEVARRAVEECHKAFQGQEVPPQIMTNISAEHKKNFEILATYSLKRKRNDSEVSEKANPPKAIVKRQNQTTNRMDLTTSD